MLRRLTIIVFCTLIPGILAWGQPGTTLRGLVLDSANHEPLPFANVFVNNTTIGTSAGLDGKFELRNLPEGRTDVVFSYVGYQSRILRFYFKNEMQIDAGSVALVQKNEELDEVQVKSKRDKEWEKRMRNFEKFLLGDVSAENCKIQNPWVINFSENSSKTSLEATALQPLEIHNYGLGYKIFFHMTGFSANPSSYSIIGQFRFEETEPLDPAQAIKWKQNRIDTYHGSERHLFKSIIEGRAAEEGFRLYVEKPGYPLAGRSDIFNAELGKSVVEYDLTGAVVKGGFAGQYFIRLPTRLEVHYVNEYATRKYYKDVPFQVSWLEVQGGHVEVNTEGVVLNSIDLVTSGAMSSQRVADLLPLDYKPYTEIGNVKVHPVARLTGWSKYRRMQEFTYVQTDKPYYYPGERIWMKAYMRYRDPELVDSLSKVLYVELIDHEKKCVNRICWPVEGGSATGHLDLPDTIPKGDYYIRAYTHWMRNYGSENFYVRPLPILSITDKVVNQPVDYDTASVIVSFLTEKPAYQTRDSIGLEILLRDQQENPIAANLSVVVTDAILVKSVADAPSILDFTLPDERTSVDRSFTVRYPSEKGINFSGIFKDDRGKPAKTTLSIVQRDFNTAIPVVTNSKGLFEVTGLNFEGRMNFGFQAMNKRGKPFGSVSILEKDYPNVDFEPVVLDLELEDTEKQIPVVTYRPGEDTRLLENVTVEAPALENLDPKSISIYGKPNFVVQGEELRQVFTGNNLIQALQGKVPGLRVTYGWDENNQDTYRVRLRGGSSSMGIGLSAIEPVLIVDGIPFSADPNSSIANFISNIPIQNVERVEVITSAVPMFGLRGTNGAILIYTKSSGVYASTVNNNNDPNMQVIPINGYQPKEKFHAPTHPAGETDSTPDLRSTIHWEPLLKADENGHAQLSFYAADLQGIYRVVVEGITVDGRIVRGEHILSIENP